jgi:DNA-binding transcriptional LysR family regulator
MLEGIDALAALEQYGTVTEAAARLRLTQSALSKRLRVLERQVGFVLVHRAGRTLRLTDRASELVERSRPVVRDLRNLTTAPRRVSEVRFSLALSDSVAASWGPQAIRDALEGKPNIHVALDTHSSALIVESVRLGRYHIGLGAPPVPARDLIEYPIIDEPIVLVHSALHAKPATGPTVTIELASPTWRAIKPQIKARHPSVLAHRMIAVETFSAVLQMARAGFGNGIVPLGLARELGVAPESYRVLSGVTRRVSLFTRKTIHQLPELGIFRDRLVAAVAARFA